MSDIEKVKKLREVTGAGFKDCNLAIKESNGDLDKAIEIFVIFYFFLIRPQQKKVKEHKAMVEGLKRGDKVVTSGGITGRVERLIDNDKVEVEIAENVKVEIVKATGIQSLLNNTPEVKK